MNEIMKMYNGKKDVNKMGVIKRLNGEERMRKWRGEECKRIEGKDGQMLNKKIVRRKEKIKVFEREMCRRLNIE